MTVSLHTYGKQKPFDLPRKVERGKDARMFELKLYYDWVCINNYKYGHNRHSVDSKHTAAGDHTN